MNRGIKGESRKMTSKGLSPNSINSNGHHLEDVIVQLEKRDQKQHLSRSSSSKRLEPDTETTNDQEMIEGCDIYQELAQKEKDLILAAEVGKALLERNEELSLANEKITEEYSHKLELLEQEKHALKRRLDTLESEYESRIAELQADLNSSKKQLEELQNVSRQTEKEKAQVIQELIEQNHRLTRELKEASESEDNVTVQLQSLREQVNARRSNITDHVAQLEGFREEITILGKRKSDLEKRIKALTEERVQLTMSIDENCERITLLEKRNQDLESTIEIQYKELEELRHANTQIHNKLDQVLRTSHRQRPSSPTANNNNNNHQPTSLFNEIEMSSSSSIEDELSKPFANGNSDDEDIECDPAFPPHDSDEFWKVRQEIAEAYHVLRRHVRELTRRRESASGSLNSTPDSGVPATPDDIRVNQVRVGLLTSVVRQLESILKDIFPEEDGPCSGCRSVAIERNELEKLRKEMIEKKETIKRMSEEGNELRKRVTILDVELKSAKEENENLKETIDSSALPKDEIIKRSMKMRDDATARKNQVEIELAKTRIEVMHINSQLMESIQQKVELSQQLEQWQVDMQSLIDDQLKKKLTEHEEAKRRTNSNNPVSKSFLNTSPAKSGLAAGLMNKSKLLKLWR